MVDYTRTLNYPWAITITPPETLETGEELLPALQEQMVARPHTALLYLAIKQPRVLFRARVGETRVDGIDQDITYTDGVLTATGTLLTSMGVPEGLTVWVGSTEDTSDKGKCRLRVPLADLTSPMKVGADMSCMWESGDYLTIVDMYEFWPKHHITETVGEDLVILKDIDLPSTEFYARPVVVMGPPACAIIDPQAGHTWVDFLGSDSYTVDPDRTIVSYTWRFEGSVGYTGSYDEVTGDTQLGVCWDTAGQYIALLEVEDDDGNVSVGVRNVFIFERTGENAPITQFSIESLSGSIDQHGWTSAIQVFGVSADPEVLPQGAQVVLFAEEFFAGYPKYEVYLFEGRQNIKMVGWLQEANISVTAATRSAAIQVVGLAEYIATFANYPVYFTQVDPTAPGWSYKAGLTVREALYHLIHWHWSLDVFADVRVEEATERITGQDFPEGSLSSQLDNVMNDVQMNWSTDRGAGLRIFKVPNLVPVEERDFSPSLLEITHDDFCSIEVSINTAPKGAQVRVEGVSVAEDGSYATHIATIPGTYDSRGFRGETYVVPSQVLAGADHAEELATLYYAWFSRRIDKVTLQMAGNYSFVDIDLPRKFTLTYDPEVRGLSWSESGFWIVGIEEHIDVANGVINVTWECVPETFPSGDAYSDNSAIGFSAGGSKGRGYIPAQIKELVGETITGKATPGMGMIVPAGAWIPGVPNPLSYDHPALMGANLPSARLTGPLEGTTYVRLWGKNESTVIAENGIVKEEMDRPVWVKLLPKSERRMLPVPAGTKPDVSYKITGVRSTGSMEECNWTLVGGETPAQQRQEATFQSSERIAHQIVFSVLGELFETDRIACSFLLGANPVYLRRARACVHTAPDGADLEISVDDDSVELITITIADGETYGESDLQVPPVLIEAYSVIDLNIDQVGSAVAGRNLTVTLDVYEMGV
jgi:hypothetical protein